MSVTLITSGINAEPAVQKLSRQKKLKWQGRVTWETGFVLDVNLNLLSDLFWSQSYLLTHHSHFIEVTGESYRQRQRKLVNGGSITEEKEVYRDNTGEEKGEGM